MASLHIALMWKVLIVHLYELISTLRGYTSLVIFLSNHSLDATLDDD